MNILKTQYLITVLVYMLAFFSACEKSNDTQPVSATPNGASPPPCTNNTDCDTTVVICATGFADIGAFTTLSSDPIITPFSISTTTQRKRSQYLFRTNELDLILSQQQAPLSTQGLCANSPIDSIAIHIDSWTGNASSGLLFRLSIKHTSISSFANAGPFDNTIDLAAACAQASPLGGNLGPVFYVDANMTGWVVFPLVSPFMWNGSDNLLIETVTLQGAGTGASEAIVHASDSLPFLASFSRFGAASDPGCSNTDPSTACAPSTYPIPGTKMLSSCGSGGASNIRPVFRFFGSVGSAPPLNSICCSNVCQDILNDSSNCGACGIQCPAGQTCVNGICQ